METRHLKLVYMVANEGTLTKASGKLFLTQSALSHHLKEIEYQLGAPIFNRSKKRMILTSLGKIVYDHASRILRNIDDLNKEINIHLNGEGGKIRLTAECYTGFHWLPPILKEFDNEYPNVDVELISSAVKDPIKNLLKGKIDLAVVLRKIPDRNIIYSKLFEDELVALFARNHRWKDKTFIKAEDFVNEHLYTHSQPFETGRVYNQVLKPKNVMPKKVTFLQLTEASIEMVKAQLGVTVMAKWSVNPYLAGKELSYRPVTSKGLKRIWYAAYLKSTELPKYTSRFIEILAGANAN